MIYQFSRATVTRCHKLCETKQQTVSSHSSGGWKSKIKFLTKHVLSEGSRKEQVICSYLWSGAIFSICWLAATKLKSQSPSSHGNFPGCLSLCLFSYYKYTSDIWLRAQLNSEWPHLNVTNYICNEPSSKQDHILRYSVLRVHHIIRETQLKP